MIARSPIPPSTPAMPGPAGGPPRLSLPLVPPLTRPLPLTRAVRAALAIGISLGTVATLASPALAQVGAGSPPGGGGGSPAAGGEAATSPRSSFSIPAGPLGQALSAFAAAAGVELTMDASLLDGRQSPGLVGQFSVAEGFAELLRGQGLQAVRQGNGSYVLARALAGAAGAAAGGAAATLPAVTVTGQAVGDGRTEGSGSYTTSVISSATRLPLSIRETPQTVTVITRERMDDQALAKPRDIMEATPGISITATAPYRETFYARGFVIENYTFDGLPVSTNSSRRGLFPSDLAMYDRVEVVRGSTGLVQGAGTPSAAINFVRKRPTRDPQASIQAQAGRWNHYGLQADVSGPLNEAGTLRGRLVGAFTDADSFQDIVGERRQLLYLIGEADLARDLVLTLSLSHQKNDNQTTYGGLPTAPDGSDLRLPRSTYLGNPWNRWDDKTTAVFASLEQKLANRWRWNLSINRLWGQQDQLRAGVSLDDGQWDQSGGKAALDSDRTSYDLYAQGPFQLFGREHELVLGAGMRSASEVNDTAGYWPPIYFARDIDIYNWQHNGIEPASFTEDYHFQSHEKQRGVYATTRLNLADPLKLILGMRFDWYRFGSNADIYDWDEATWGLTTNRYAHDRHLTKYAGLVYELNREHAVYASYTDIFKPQNSYDASQRLIEPIVGKNYEVGIKGEYFGGALNASAALFRIDQANLAMADGPCPYNPNQTCYRAAGLVRSEGFDLEVQGALTPNWQLGAGFTYVTTEVRRDRDPARIGLRVNTQLPSRQFKLATTYRLPGDTWRVGGSVRWQGDVFYQWTGGPYRNDQKAYAVFDAMAGYRFSRQLDFQLNLTNLFDKVYYRSINAQPVIWGGNTVYGTPRSVMLTARYRF